MYDPPVGLPLALRN